MYIFQKGKAPKPFYCCLIRCNWVLFYRILLSFAERLELKMIPRKHCFHYFKNKILHFKNFSED